MLTFASIATEHSPAPQKQSWIWASDLTCLSILQPTTDPSQTHKKHLHQVTHLCSKAQNIVSSKRCRIAPCCIWPSAFMFIHHSSFQIAFRLISVRICSVFGKLWNDIQTQLFTKSFPLLVASFFCPSFSFFPFSWLSCCLLISYFMVDWLYIDCSNFTHLYRYYWICPVSCCVFIAICK